VLAVLAFLFTATVALLWLAALKFFPRLHSALVLGLALLYAGGCAWSVSERASLIPTTTGLVATAAALLLFFAQKRGRLSPLLAGPRRGLAFSLPWLRAGFLLALAVPGAVRLLPLGLEVLLGQFCLALVASEGARRVWRNLGLLALPGAGAAVLWLVAGLAWWGWQHDLAGAAALLLFLRRSPQAAEAPQTLSPSQATVMLKLPMVTMNALIEVVPAAQLAQWFRPDPYRLHLREPLLETQNAPAYLAAFATHLNRTYSEKICNENQLADFCLAYPESAARALLSFPPVDPSPAGPEFTSADLGALRKPGKVTQLAHLVRLRKIR